MPLPNTLTGKWRCVCPNLHCWESERGTWDAQWCSTCNYQSVIHVRAEQSGSFDQRENEEID